jgi:O-antigen/teichoic acid export membrane protein
MTKSLPTLGGLWKTGSIYLISFWLNSALPLLLTPVLTRYLSPSDYGVSAMWQVLLSFTIPVVGLSTHAAINRRYFQKNADPAQHHADMRDYIASIFPILAGTSLLVIVAYVLTYPLIIRYLLPTSAIWVLTVPAVAIATFLYNATLSYLNAEMRAKAYAVLNNGHVLATSLIAILFVVGLGWNWQGRVMGAILGMTLAATASMIYLWRRGLLGGRIRRDMAMHAMLFSLPLLPHILTIMVRGVSDRVFLSQIADLHEIGLFSVALAMAGIFNILGNAAMQAWIPWLYAHLGADKVDRVKIVKITYAAIAAIASLGILFAVLAPFLFGSILGPRFDESAKYIWWLTGAAVLQGAYYFLVPYIAYVERNKYSSYISMGTLGVNLLLNFVLIYFFGVMGVAAANFFTALYEFIAVFIVANYCMPMPWVSFFYRTAPALSSADNQGGGGS